MALVHPDDYDSAMNAMKGHFTGLLEKYETEYRILTKSGEYKWFYDVGSIVKRDSNGVPLKVTGIVIDISERKRAEDALHKSMKQYDNLVSNIPIGVYILRSTPEGGSAFEYVSPKLAEIFNVSAENFLADPKFGFEPIHPDDLAGLVALNQERFQDPRAFEWEGRAIVQGVVRWLQIASSPEAQENGDVLWHGIVVDITERKRAEGALHESEEKWRSLFEILPVGVSVIDSNHTVTDLNSALSQILEITKEGLLNGNYKGRKYLRSDNTPMSAEEFPSIRAAKEQEIIKNVEIGVEKENGTITWTNVSAAPLLSGVDVVIVTADITQRKQADEQIRQLNASLEQRVRERTALLQASNQELETFAYTISHDLRSPLRAMDSFSAMLVSDYSEKMDQQGLHYLARIREGSQRMGQLIEDLLNLSKVTRSELTRRQVDLSQLAQEMAAELISQSPQRSVEFDISPNLVVDGDAAMLKIVLENLLSNAFKFSNQREKASIQFGMSAQTGERVYFVRDNGVGFNMAYAGKLFAPFQRLHGIHEFPGSGIGLVTVQRIVARHGGRIWPEAAVNQGATFYFTLGGA
jgi:PAS domain S-box-containing protein